MDRNKIKGQYFLTGSKNFSVLHTIAESIASMAAIFPVDNFTPKEITRLEKHSIWISDYVKTSKEFYKKKAAFFLLSFLLLHCYFEDLPLRQQNSPHHTSIDIADLIYKLSSKKMFDSLQNLIAP